MMHGFFATYLYASYLNGSIRSAPLFTTMVVWILVGPAVGFVTRSLLARKEQPNVKAAIVDASFYGFIFFLAACGVSSGIKANASLIASIMAGFLMIVPIARSLSAYKTARAKHRELNEGFQRILIYGLLFIPAILPVVSFLHVCGLSDTLTLFLINFITFDFVLIVAVSMIASADRFVDESVAMAEAVETPVEVPADTKIKPLPQSMASDEASAKRQPLAPQKVASGNPDDPIIQFLNSNSDSEGSQKAPKKQASPRKLGKPVHAGLTPPKKPNKPNKSSMSEHESEEKTIAPNAPSRIKAPAKPKKRF
jgi:hypothetical protein